MNLINGTPATEPEIREYLDRLNAELTETLSAGYPDTETVISAADTLSQSLCLQDAVRWTTDPNAADTASVLLAQAKHFLSRAYLERKIELELGSDVFSFHNIGNGRKVAYRPLGVITHIAAGNAQGLPAYSVLEGLLTGNINLLKLPGRDDGLSTALLNQLIEIEPRLKRYISVFDLPSTDLDSIQKLLAASDAVAVWGSDFAVSGIRALAPPHLQLIEWGHKISFSCVTQKGETSDALAEIARDICETEQLICSAPQCVYYEADTFEELVSFGNRLAKALKSADAIYPTHTPDLHTQAEITELRLLASLEELLVNKKLLHGSGFVIIACEDPTLIASPGFRTVWLKPMRAGSFDQALRERRGYLQTAGLFCSSDEREQLLERLFRHGVCRGDAQRRNDLQYCW